MDKAQRLPHKLIGVGLLREFIQTIILTGRLQGYPPVSTMLIAQPERGKTSVALESGTESIMPLTDVTGKGLSFVCQLAPKVTHIVISDMAVVMAHGHKAREYFFSVLLAMLEEGIQSFAGPAGITSITGGGGRRGIISCITTDQANDQRSVWYKRGLARRMVPFHFDYPLNLVRAIKDAIDGDVSSGFTPSILFKVPDAAIKVEIGARESQRIRFVADKKAEQMGQLGISLLKNYRSLARSHALLRTWKNAKVQDTDVHFLERIDPYVDWKTPALL